jgi:hypothetical protein
MRDYDKAIAAYQQGMQIDPKLAGPDAALGIAWAYFFKAMASAGKDLPQVKEWTGKAAAGGRSVTALSAQIDKLEKAIAAHQIMTQEQIADAQKQQQAADEANKRIEQANALVGSRNPANRGRGCRELAVVAGPNAVSALVTLMQQDPDYDVRIACTNALGSLGPAARAAIPNVTAMLKQPVLEVGVNPTPQQLENSMKDGDYKRALRDALQRIK